MMLSELLSTLRPVSLPPLEDLEISGLSEDSREAGRGFLFFARQGARTSGADFAREAVAKGAAVVLSEREIPNPGAPVVVVPSMAQAQARIADKFYGHPSRELTLVGVTGTNGKTTITYMLESIAAEMGWRAGMIGTISYRLPGKRPGEMETLAAPNTTPNALTLQKILRTLCERKADAAFMEVSSHALALGRVEGIEFDGAVFTNLTQDHFDFHKDMQNYFEAKSLLFKMLRPEKKRKPAGGRADCGKFGITNLDDPYGRKLTALSAAPVAGYAIRSEAEFRAREVALSPAGTQFVLNRSGKEARVRMRLLGQHNVYNALAAAGAAAYLGVPLEKIAAGLEKLESVPGRLEPVPCGQDFAVLVDYAHTEDALKNVLTILRQIAKGRLLTLFGCGGDRDRSKRPLMGATAVQMSDWVVVTSDNPRSEDPKKITLDIEVGIHRTGKTNYEVVVDREKAVEKILSMAAKDDIVLLAGKGHETYQIFADRTDHFDDREAARKFLCSR